MRDRSWTIASTLLWFGSVLISALLWFDGDVDAIADRLTSRREPESDSAPAAGPTFAPRPVRVADADEAKEDVRSPAIPDKGDRSRVGALEDVCTDGSPTACKR